TIHNDYTYQVVVSTHLGNAHTSLSYTAATQVWTLNTHTPNEWQLAQGNGIVTLRCLLEDVQNAQLPDYKVEVESVEGKAYPAYQLYEDNNGTTWCSKVKMKSHAEGNQWIKDCLKAHPNTRVNGKPWTSNHQKGN